MATFRLKTSEQITLLREGGALLATILQNLTEQAIPGASMKMLDAEAERQIRAVGGEPVFLGYHGYPASVCLSRNEEVVHGIPGDRLLNEGDLLGIDIGMRYRGFVTDMAVTVPVGTISASAQQLLDTTRDALRAGIDAARVGARVGDIGAAVMHVVEPKGYGIVRALVGHGVGFELHEDPSIPNWGCIGEGPVLVEGAVIAIEPMITAGSPRVRTLPDQWTVVTKDGSLAAHFEHTIAITAEGPEILTAFKSGFSF